jgi:glycosyltransferase involved in cell wall biosynthesis
MITKSKITVVADGREFQNNNRTGISRVIEGILKSLLDSSFIDKICVAILDKTALPKSIDGHKRLVRKILPGNNLHSELLIWNSVKSNFDIFLSPYPKLPIINGNCKLINIVHDIFYLYNDRKLNLKYHIDLFRLKAALKKADLTWYDSITSMSETKSYIGFTGKNPKVRYPGVDLNKGQLHNKDTEILASYGLERDYILCLGNGGKHKNLGLIINLASKLNRKVALIGVNNENKKRLLKEPNAALCNWVGFVEEKHLSTIFRNSFCLAQPSLAEGYGYPPLEAMGYGVPVIVSDIDVLKETTGNNAVIVNPFDEKGWLDAFQRLEDNEFYYNQVEKGQSWAEKFCSEGAWKPYVKDVEDLVTHIRG